MKKGQKFAYRAGSGNLYSAIVLRAHRDGTYTVRVYFALDKIGREIEGTMQGDKYRIGAANVAEWIAL